MLFRQSAFVVAGIVCLGLVGCGNNSIGRKPVAGTVTMDGEPLDYGAINFQPVDSNAHVVGAGAVITDGEFSIPADQGLTPGKYRVSIMAPSGAPEDRQGEDAMKNPGPPPVERLPPRYNTETELTAEVTNDTPTAEFEFSVESIKK